MRHQCIEMGLQTNDGVTWKSLDGRNCYQIRILRRHILRNVISNQSLRPEEIVDLESLTDLDFSQPELAVEAASLIWEVLGRVGRREEAIGILSGSEINQPPEWNYSNNISLSWWPDGVPRSLNLSKWLTERRSGRRWPLFKPYF